MSRPPAVFVVDAVEEFLRTKAAREPATIAKYRGILLGAARGTKPSLGLPLASYFANRRFSTVTEDEVATWFGKRVAGGAQDTKNGTSKAARAFFRFARQRGYTSLDLADEIPQYAAGAPRRDWLGWEDIHALLDAIPEPRYRFAAAWLFYTGCRVGEAIGAKQTEVRRMPDHDMWIWSIPTSKTHQARQVWLPDTLVGYLRQARSEHQPKPDWPLLWDCDGRGFGRVENPSASITAATIRGFLERARATAGISVKVTPHTARHSFCTNWIHDCGHDEHSMMKLSRHVGASVARLRATYVHVEYGPEDWAHLRSLGARHTANPSSSING